MVQRNYTVRYFFVVLPFYSFISPSTREANVQTWPRRHNQKSVKRLSYSRHTNFNLGGVEFRRHGVSDEVDLSSPWIGEGVGWTRIRDDRKVLHLHSTKAKMKRIDDVLRYQYKGHEVSRERNDLSHCVEALRHSQYPRSCVHGVSVCQRGGVLANTDKKWTLKRLKKPMFWLNYLLILAVNRVYSSFRVRYVTCVYLYRALFGFKTRFQ